jgi:hypothetical protein
MIYMGYHKGCSFNAIRCRTIHTHKASHLAIYDTQNDLLYWSTSNMAYGITSIIFLLNRGSVILLITKKRNVLLPSCKKCPL